MKKFQALKLIALFIVLLCLSQCSKRYSSEDSSGKVKGGKSIYTEKMQVQYSKSFEIEYLDSAKVIRVFSPEKGKKKVVSEYLLLPHGVRIPKGYEDSYVVRIPVKSVIALTSIYTGFLDKLGLTDKIIAVDNFQYVYSPKLRAMIDAKKVAEAGDAFNVNVEKIFSLKPDLVLTYGNGDVKADANNKLIANGIHFASTTLHLENSPLARAEWIKFIAAFFDSEKKANEIFDNLQKEYNKLTLLTKDLKERPSVFTEALLGGMWYEPGGESYLAKLLKDAGANYIWKDDPSSGSLTLSFEQVYEKAHDADYWINVHFWNKTGDALKNDPRNSKFKAFRTKNIFNYNASINSYGYYEYWEDGVINCDIVLADMIKIFHPEIMQSHSFRYYKELSD
ncbi:MAG: ABC transporter substrate-binding protein [Bacteroidota bacterium]|nr:ABC transporter substrate-binding protein [Bacteroidota bacterium]MDP4190872.1 ABC transporter substrate-binding protein [Bacteroidota bacterium]